MYLPSPTSFCETYCWEVYRKNSKGDWLLLFSKWHEQQSRTKRSEAEDPEGGKTDEREKRMIVDARGLRPQRVGKKARRRGHGWLVAHNATASSTIRVATPIMVAAKGEQVEEQCVRKSITDFAAKERTERYADPRCTAA